MKNVMTLLLFFPHLVSGDPSEKVSDGFPISNVGNNGMDSPFENGIECAKLEHQPPAFNSQEESP
jgi:hypothetical protein